MYETKSLLAAIGSLARITKASKVFYDELMKIANVEGVLLEPYEDGAEEQEVKNEEN